MVWNRTVKYTVYFSLQDGRFGDIGQDCDLKVVVAEEAGGGLDLS